MEKRKEVLMKSMMMIEEWKMVVLKKGDYHVPMFQEG
jgi:hypothetical protein